MAGDQPVLARVVSQRGPLEKDLLFAGLDWPRQLHVADQVAERRRILFNRVRSGSTRWPHRAGIGRTSHESYDATGRFPATRTARCSTFYMAGRTAGLPYSTRARWTGAAAGLVGFGVAAASTPTRVGGTPHVEQADLVGDINTIMAAYIDTAVSRAQSAHADALLIVMNTPGGISTSMDGIVTSLLNSKVPVIVFVYPSGARAASAGLFVARPRMSSPWPRAPTSARPSDSGHRRDLTGDLGAKVLNDAVTRVRTLASMHGRNADWAEHAVRNSVNINAEEAVRLHVADLEVSDPAALMKAIDGRSLPRASGTLVLHTAGARIEDFRCRSGRSSSTPSSTRRSPRC